MAMSLLSEINNSGCKDVCKIIPHPDIIGNCCTLEISDFVHVSDNCNAFINKCADFLIPTIQFTVCSQHFSTVIKSDVTRCKLRS